MSIHLSSRLSMPPATVAGDAARDRASAQAWITTTLAQHPDRWVFPIYLNSAELEVGAAEELLRPANAIANGAVNRCSYVVVALDAAVKRYFEFAAKAHALPIWISDSVDDYYQAKAEPAGTLTPADEQTLHGLKALGGRATAAQLGDQLGLRPAAAGGRLESVVGKGFVFRESRSKRDGDLYVVPLFAEPGETETGTPTTAVSSTIALPDEVRNEIRRLAADRQMSEEELLAEAWVTYLRAHTEELEAERRAELAMSDEEYVASRTRETRNSRRP